MKQFTFGIQPDDLGVRFSDFTANMTNGEWKQLSSTKRMYTTTVKDEFAGTSSEVKFLFEEATDFVLLSRIIDNSVEYTTEEIRAIGIARASVILQNQ